MRKIAQYIHLSADSVYKILIHIKLMIFKHTHSTTITSTPNPYSFLKIYFIIFLCMSGHAESLQQLAENVLLPKRLEHRSEGSNRHQLKLSNEQCGCCPRQFCPTVSLWSVTLCLSISLCCLGISMGPSQPTSKTNATQSHTGSTGSTGSNDRYKREGQLRLLFLGVLTRHTLIDFRKFPVH